MSKGNLKSLRLRSKIKAPPTKVHKDKNKVQQLSRKNWKNLISEG